MSAALNASRMLVRRQNVANILKIARTSSSLVVSAGKRRNFLLNPNPNDSNKLKKLQTSSSTLALNYILRQYSTTPDQNIMYEELLTRVKDGSLQLIDVRQPEEYQKGIIGGSVNIPIGEFGQSLFLEPDEFEAKYKAKKPEKTDTNVAFYCLAGVRSAGAVAMANAVGYKHVRHFPGGWAEWAEKQGLKTD